MKKDTIYGLIGILVFLILFGVFIYKDTTNHFTLIDQDLISEQIDNALILDTTVPTYYPNNNLELYSIKDLNIPVTPVPSNFYSITPKELQQFRITSGKAPNQYNVIKFPKEVGNKCQNIALSRCRLPPEHSTRCILNENEIPSTSQVTNNNGTQNSCNCNVNDICQLPNKVSERCYSSVYNNCVKDKFNRSTPK